ncbi:MAG: hypothetical protein AAFQ94_17580 [Bacteroidota bacterium]
MLKLLVLAGVLNFSAQNDTIPFINSTEIFQQVAELYKDQKYGELVNMLEKIPESDSNFYNSQIVLLEVYEANDQTDKAKKVLDDLMVNHLETSTNFYIQGGNLYLNSDEPDRAIAIYKQGLKKYPFSEVLHYNIGYGFYSKADYEESIEYFIKAIQINPYYHRAHQMLGTIMAQSKYRTRAMLSFLTSLAMEPNANWVLVRLNNLVNDAYMSEGIIDLQWDNTHFAYYDDLIKSRAVFDERYQTNVSMTVPVAQQSEMIINKIKQVAGTDDFWMDFYVPFFQSIAKEDLTAAFVNFALLSSENENISEWLSKNKAKKEEWIAIANQNWDSYNDFHEREIMGKSKVYKHWYNDDGDVSAVGNENGDLKVGPWMFIHENGTVKAIGEYNPTGDRMGKWEFYYDNGQLDAIENYDNKGTVDGDYVSYSREGKKLSELRYKNGEAEGLSRSFYSCGGVEEEYPYQSGVGNGAGRYYYETGELSIEYNVKNDELDGLYKIYFKNGQIQKTINYKNGKTEGEFRSYYADGSQYQTGQYKDGAAEGEWSYFYRNGVLNSKGNFSADNQTGKWESFYENGNLEGVSILNEDGQLTGKSTWYDLDGIKHYEKTYDKDLLVAYQYFDKSGTILSSGEDNEGNMDYEYYYPTGQLFSKGTLKGGKLSGDYKTYFLNGKLQQEGLMRDDQWDGEYKEYYGDGVLKLHTSYKEGSFDGYLRSYFENGKIKREGWYQNGNPEQTFLYYYPDGMLESVYSYSEGKLQGVVKYYDPEGRIVTISKYDAGVLLKTENYDTLGKNYQTVILPSDGEVKENYAGGELAATYGIKCNKTYGSHQFYYKNGDLSGEYKMENSLLKSYKSYNEQGQLLVEGGYLINSKEGKWNYYYSDGKKMSTFTYSSDQLNGKEYQYYENGKTKLEGNYYKGELHGPRKYFSPSGNLQLIKHYVAYVGPVGYQYQLPNGQLSDTIKINMNGKYAIKAYYRNGKPSVVQDYQDYYFSGKSVFYDENGKIQRVSNFKNGDLDGDRIEYYSNGKTKHIQNYVMDQRNGEEKYFYENGKIKKTINWKFDSKNGWARTYDEQGKLLLEKYYRNDAEY